MRPGWFFSLLLALGLTGASARAQIRVGQAAPPLRLSQLLQAPSGASANWHSLRGKVVVLEFWATWCGSCIEEIPHLNSIVASVGSGQVQFIAVDDQTAATLKKFVAKYPIRGWLGIDTSGTTIHAYGAEVRPRTVVVDTLGRIAAILSPAQLTAAALLLLAEGGNPAFPADTTEPLQKQMLSDAAKLDALAAAGGSALFDISVRRSDPKEQSSSILDDTNAGGVKIDAINLPLQELVSFMGLPLDRIRLSTNPAASYSLHVNAPGETLEQVGPAIQLAVASAAKLHLVRTDAEEEVWAIEKTPKSKSLLQPGDSKKGRVCMYQDATKKVILEGCSLDQLATALEYYLSTPVLNETGIAGEFNAIFELKQARPEAVNSALENNMGLKLVRERRRVERITFEP